jgi:hypothetical protein
VAIDFFFSTSVYSCGFGLYTKGVATYTADLLISLVVVIGAVLASALAIVVMFCEAASKLAT